MKVLSRYRNAYSEDGREVASSSDDARYNTKAEYLYFEKDGPVPYGDGGEVILDEFGKLLPGKVAPAGSTQTPLAVKSNYTTLLIGLGIAAALIITVLLISKQNANITPQ